MSDARGPDAFESIAAELDYPMVVVTAAAGGGGSGGGGSGCLVGFTTQCSIEPVRYLVCISKANHTWAIARATDTLVVHVLREGDRDIAEIFGEETGDAVEKFTRCAWRPGPGGAPVIEGLDWFAGAVIDRVDGGDHTAMVLEPFDGEHRHHDPQLGFQALHDMEPGHDA